MTVQVFVDEAEAETLRVLGTAMKVLVDAEHTRGAYEVVLVESGRGGDLVPHRHPWEEMYFVLDGTIEVLVGRRRKVMGRGGLVTLPARCLHAFAVLSDSARFLHVSMGRGAVDTFRDLNQNLPPFPTPDDVELVLGVLARHDIEVVLDGPAPLAPEGARADGGADLEAAAS